MDKENISKLNDKMSIIYGYEQLKKAIDFIESWLNEEVNIEILNYALDDELECCLEMVNSCMPDNKPFSEEHIPNYWIDYQRIVLNYMIHKGGYDFPVWTLAFRVLCEEVAYDIGGYFADYVYHNNIDTNLALKWLPKEEYSNFKWTYKGYKKMESEVCD